MVTTNWPSGLKLAPQSIPECPRKAAIRSPVRPSHKKAVWSRAADTTRVPSGLNAIDWTMFVCPAMTLMSWPVDASQSRGEGSGKSQVAEISRDPAGLMANHGL